MLLNSLLSQLKLDESEDSIIEIQDFLQHPKTGIELKV